MGILESLKEKIQLGKPFFKIIAQNSRFTGSVFIIVVLLFMLISIVTEVVTQILTKNTQFAILLILMAILYMIYIFFIDFEKNRIGITHFIIFPGLLLLFFIKIKIEIIHQTLYWILSTIAIVAWFSIYSFFLSKFPSKYNSYKMAYVIMGCQIFLVIGSLIVFDFVFDEEHTLGLRLNECGTNNKIYGAEFTCEGLRKDVFVGAQANCKITGLEQERTRTTLNFTYLNGTSESNTFLDQISFIVPPDVARVYVDIRSIDTEGSICASSSHSMTFTSYENLKQQRKEVGFYLIAMISFMLLSIPTIVRKWIELFSH